MVNVEQGMNAKQVVAQLKQVLESLEHDYAALGYEFAYNGVTQIPHYGRIAVYAVTGGSEGHYVHVDLITGVGEHTNLLLVKTFAGMTHARQIANTLADAMEV
jgi:hypothetical protein